MYKKKDNIILERMIILALNSFKGVISSNKNYNFRCNVCGDGNNSKNKRGHIRYDNRGEFFYYKCFNNGCKANTKTWSAEKWLKYTSKSLYNEYIKEKFYNDTEENVKSKLDNTKLKDFTEVKHTSKLESIYKLDDIDRIDGKLFEEIKNYCDKRLIPIDIWKDWYICTKGKYQNRIIIPFYNKDKKIYYFQARALGKLEPKYLNKVSGKKFAIYNIFNVEKQKPIIVFEGIIDSLMVENSIAVIGVSTDKKTQEILDSYNCYWLFDNDTTGINKSKQYLKNGKYVFLWNSFLKDNNLVNSHVKDINDVCVTLNKKEKYTFLELEKYFTNNYYDLIKI